MKIMSMQTVLLLLIWQWYDEGDDVWDDVIDEDDDGWDDVIDEDDGWDDVIDEDDKKNKEEEKPTVWKTENKDMMKEIESVRLTETLTHTEKWLPSSS